LTTSEEQAAAECHASGYNYYGSGYIVPYSVAAVQEGAAQGTPLVTRALYNATVFSPSMGMTREVHLHLSTAGRAQDDVTVAQDDVTVAQDDVTVAQDDVTAGDDDHVPLGQNLL
jgi:hypothetical protein